MQMCLFLLTFSSHMHNNAPLTKSVEKLLDVCNKAMREASSYYLSMQLFTLVLPVKPLNLIKPGNNAR